jgi:hypothetical protein
MATRRKSGKGNSAADAKAWRESWYSRKSNTTFTHDGPPDEPLARRGRRTVRSVVSGGLPTLGKGRHSRHG